ncbi:MAG: DUF5995 family protein [Gordonia sp. (in: high G+C Gram-positive bacteria)]|jgi:uncharacterized protein YndB with AHSA1/START domain|nr:DUF5995 family protein [Gordonia sp. (in: high G+C Gram-positive bacteria)]
MTTFTVTRTLRCSREQAWTMLTVPEQMNRWSTARIDLFEHGVGDRPDGVGTLRTVTLPGGRARLKEVVESSEFPSRFAYRVHDGGPALLDHRGELALVTTSDGCRLTWTVRMQLVPAVATAAVARTIRRQLGESLDTLALLDPPEAVAPPDVSVRTARDVAPLRTQALAVLDAQRATAQRLAAEDDPKQWFARVYSYVTEEMIKACDRGDVDNPDWVLDLIPVFDEYYTRNLSDYEAGRECEPMWQRAWSRCERSDERRPHLPVMSGLLAGVAAHIDADLPRALAGVHRSRYADTDLRAFRPDYLRLSPVFTAASNSLLADLPRSHKPWWTGLATRVHPQLRDSLLARKGYDVGRHRFEAFARALETAS